jgi:hypothetical protein
MQPVGAILASNLTSKIECVRLSLRLLVGCWLTAADLPTTNQFDLVLSRNDIVHQPVYPFPVVFVLHKLSSA